MRNRLPNRETVNLGAGTHKQNKMKVELLTKTDLERIEFQLDQMMQRVQSTESGITKVYSTIELAEKLKVSTKTVQNWREQRLIEYSQVNNKLFYTEKSVNEFLASHSIKRFQNSKTPSTIK